MRLARLTRARDLPLTRQPARRRGLGRRVRARTTPDQQGQQGQEDGSRAARPSLPVRPERRAAVLGAWSAWSLGLTLQIFKLTCPPTLLCLARTSKSLRVRRVPAGPADHAGASPVPRQRPADLAVLAVAAVRARAARTTARHRGRPADQRDPLHAPRVSQRRQLHGLRR